MSPKTAVLSLPLLLAPAACGHPVDPPRDAGPLPHAVFVYTVPGSATNCLPWPTGRGNYLRNGFFR
jgi:hypothetical protein